jgi:hypothetical protein
VASAIDILATTEGLPSHADSVKLRVEDWHSEVENTVLKITPP